MTMRRKLRHSGSKVQQCLQLSGACSAQPCGGFTTRLIHMTDSLPVLAVLLCHVIHFPKTAITHSSGARMAALIPACAGAKRKRDDEDDEDDDDEGRR